MRLVAALLVLAAAVAARADVTPATVAALALKWEASFGGVSGGPIVKDGTVYVASWNSRVWAFDAVTGEEKWSTTVAGAVPGRLLLLDDGGVCYGTLLAEVGCLNGTDGSVRWQTMLDDLQPAAVWSAPIAANGRLFVGIASINDDPQCARGRLVALDLANGNELWRFYTVPDKVCDTDTSVECAGDGDCPHGGTCVTGRGGGVTATPAVDPTGAWVYMNTVGCYTFPSIGESDSMFKIDAATGQPEWRRRVDDPEQFGACTDDTAVDCGVDADCGVGATCSEKFAYHDFGFLNGPLLVEVPDGPGTKRLVVSGSKNGTLYAFDEATGEIEWTNPVRAKPVSPGFAGFGLFNGALALAGDRLYAALFAMIPPRVCSNDARVACTADGDCPGGTCPPEPEHLMAFDTATGATVWSAEIGRSWSHVAVANGVVYAGTNTEDAEGASQIFAHDAATGARLATFDVPATSAARAAVAGDTLYLAYGLGAGGLRAYSLCANATLDPGEECDPGPPADGDCCTASCTFEAAVACDDGDACTSGDACGAGTCAGTVATAEQVGCTLQQLDGDACSTPLPAGLEKGIGRAVKRTTKLLGKITATDKEKKVERLRKKMLKALDGIAKKAAKAAAARKEAKRITPECRAALDALVAARRTLIEGFAF